MALVAWETKDHLLIIHHKKWLICTKATTNGNVCVPNYDHKALEESKSNLGHHISTARSGHVHFWRGCEEHGRKVCFIDLQKASKWCIICKNKSWWMRIKQVIMFSKMKTQWFQVALMARIWSSHWHSKLLGKGSWLSNMATWKELPLTQFYGTNENKIIFYHSFGSLLLYHYSPSIYLAHVVQFIS